MMSLFDAPDREVSCVKRNRSNTPLQSLALFNETMRIEMARKFAERLIKEAQTDDQRLNLAFKLLASRKASPTEQKACLELLKDLKTEFIADPAKAKNILAIGDSPNDSTINTIEQAAWSQLPPPFWPLILPYWSTNLGEQI